MKEEIKGLAKWKGEKGKTEGGQKCIGCTLGEMMETINEGILRKSISFWIQHIFV